MALVVRTSQGVIRANLAISSMRLKGLVEHPAATDSTATVGTQMALATSAKMDFTTRLVVARLVERIIAPHAIKIPARNAILARTAMVSMQMESAHLAHLYRSVRPALRVFPSVMVARTVSDLTGSRGFANLASIGTARPATPIRCTVTRVPTGSTLMQRPGSAWQHSRRQLRVGVKAWTDPLNLPCLGNAAERSIGLNVMKLVQDPVHAIRQS